MTASAARLEWRPSPWFVAALLTLGVLAAFAVVASEMPRLAAWPLALAALAYGIAIAGRERARPAVALVIAAGDEVISTIDGRPAEDLQLRWRGPLAVLRWRDDMGRTRRLAFWPDVLPAASRRELRLAAAAASAARSPASMAR
ncbi:MAG: hypothetical protein ACREO8_03325 [Luteimonas sp.]